MKPNCMETEVPSDELIVSHTNPYGIITYANETFAHISGYELDDLLGRPHRIVRHPDMPSSLFANMWETLGEGKMWSGYVKNLRSDGGFYWVYAQVSKLFDKQGAFVGYKSLRAPVELSKRRELEVSYAKLKEMEEHVTKLSEWIDLDTYRKLERLSSEENQSIATFIKEKFGS